MFRNEPNGIFNGPELTGVTGKRQHKDVLDAATEAKSQGIEEEVELNVVKSAYFFCNPVPPAPCQTIKVIYLTL